MKHEFIGKSREELMEEKLRTDLRLTEIKTALLRAKSRVATTGRYLDPNTYASLEIERGRLAARSQRIQMQIGALSAQDKLDRQQDFLQCFREAAEQVLAKKTLVLILDAAHAINRARQLKK